MTPSIVLKVSMQKKQKKYYLQSHDCNKDTKKRKNKRFFDTATKIKIKKYIFTRSERLP